MNFFGYTPTTKLNDTQHTVNELTSANVKWHKAYSALSTELKTFKASVVKRDTQHAEKVVELEEAADSSSDMVWRLLCQLYPEVDMEKYLEQDCLRKFKRPHGQLTYEESIEVYRDVILAKVQRERKEVAFDHKLSVEKLQAEKFALKTELAERKQQQQTYAKTSEAIHGKALKALEEKVKTLSAENAALSTNLEQTKTQLTVFGQVVQQLNVKNYQEDVRLGAKRKRLTDTAFNPLD